MLHDLLRQLPQAYVVPQYRCNSDNAKDSKDTPDFDVVNFPKQGDLAFVEYSVIDPLQRSTMPASARSEGHAASKRDNEKIEKYRLLALETNHQIHPAVQETSGRLSKGYKRILHLCDEMRDPSEFETNVLPHLTWACTSFLQYYTQRIAVGFWSGCAKMESTRHRLNVLRTTGRFPPAARNSNPNRRHGWAAPSSFSNGRQ